MCDICHTYDIYVTHVSYVSLLGAARSCQEIAAFSYIQLQANLRIQDKDALATGCSTLLLTASKI